MGGLRQVSARPFDGKIEVHCATYFKIAVVTPRSPKVYFPDQLFQAAETKNPQPVATNS